MAPTMMSSAASEVVRHFQIEAWIPEAPGPWSLTRVVARWMRARSGASARWNKVGRRDRSLSTVGSKGGCRSFAKRPQVASTTAVMADAVHAGRHQSFRDECPSSSEGGSDDDSDSRRQNGPRRRAVRAGLGRRRAQPGAGDRRRPGRPGVRLRMANRRSRTPSTSSRSPRSSSTWALRQSRRPSRPESNRSRTRSSKRALFWNPEIQTPVFSTIESVLETRPDARF